MYTIWVPFELAPNHDFDLNEPVQFEVCGYPARLIKQLGHTGLQVEGLPGEDAARELLPKVNAGLLYAVVGWGRALMFGWEPVPLVFKDGDPLIYWILGGIDDTPHPFDASRTAIYPSDKRFTDGRITIGMETSMPANGFVETFQRGLVVPSLRDGVTDRKIRFGGELYCLSNFEASDRAKFLTLCTALEVLAPRRKLPKTVRGHINRWAEEAKGLARDAKPATKEQDALRSLAGQLTHLETASITASLKDYVLDTLSRDGKFPAQEKAVEVARLYGLRGSVVHGGADVDHRDLFKLEEIVRMTLVAAMRLQTPDKGS